MRRQQSDEPRKVFTIDVRKKSSKEALDFVRKIKEQLDNKPDEVPNKSKGVGKDKASVLASPLLLGAYWALAFFALVLYLS